MSLPIYRNRNETQIKRKPWQEGVINILEITNTGIDLEEKHLEIRKIFIAKGFAKKCRNVGCDPEDVLQEIYKGILIRNKGSCPFDKSKSAFSTYVFMVIKCVTLNCINKKIRVTSREYIGHEDSIENCNHIPHQSPSESSEETLLVTEIKELLSSQTKVIFQDLMDGHRLSHISRARNIEKSRLNSLVTQLQKTVSSLGLHQC